MSEKVSENVSRETTVVTVVLHGSLDSTELVGSCQLILSLKVLSQEVIRVFCHIDVLNTSFR